MQIEEEFINSLNYSDLSRALSRDFFKVYCVNTDTDVFVEFIPHEEDERLDVRMTGDDFTKVADDMKENAYSEDADMVRTAITKKNILNVLAVDSSFLLDYRMMKDGEPTYVKLKAVRIRKDDPSHVLMAMSNTDLHMQRLAKYEQEAEKNLTYAAVSEALAADYVCIYYVDIVTGQFIEYNSSELYKSMELSKEGDDFFTTCKTEFIHKIYEEDRDLFLNGFQKENLKRVLAEDHKFILTFRIVMKGKPIYIRLKVTKMIGENDHIVIGLSNIDESMKRTAKYQQLKEIANKDSMTGVKSKHAYKMMEEQLNRKIEEGISGSFAIAVCDVNGLKQINDTLGHKAGDQYIIDACTLICDVFKHSPVYRIGGDEFVVLLKGYDYENRPELLYNLNRVVEKNKDTGGVVVSVGVSQFIHGEDANVAAVFERADSLMYQRKAQLKGAGEEIR